MKADIDSMRALRQGRASELGDFHTTVTPDFFKENAFGMGNVNTKTFILMLAQCKPLSFISGAPVDLATTLKAGNRTEYHHIMPRAFLKASGQSEPGDSILSNFCFLSRTDNRTLGGVAPSLYKAEMASNIDEILAHALIPESVFTDRYADFVNDRAEILNVKARQLCEI